jgi:hypothetical protein
MRFKEILQISEVNLFEAIDFDQEDYGNWQVKMSKKPVVMGQVTGPEAKYVALIQHRRKKDIKIFGTGSSQAAAREDGLTKAQATDRSDNVDKFKSFTGDLNVNFTKEYLEADTVPFYKFERNSEGIFLVQASKKYFKEFGREIEQLGFKKASGRLSRMGEMATQIYGFSISKNTIKEIGLVPNMRYALKYVNDDEDGNAMFLMVADSRAQGPQDKYRMNMPGITIAGTLTDDINEDLRKWFKDKWVRFGPDGKIRGDCARGSESEGKPKCLPQSKAQALGKKKRASAAAKKRREDPNAERRGAAKNVATKVRKEQFDEKCWTGYHKEGNKKMFGKTVPNCVKNEDVVESSVPFNQCPHCRGPIVHESQLNEKKDACYHKVKSRYKVWPSAYASGALVQCRKKGAKNWGKKS